MHRNKISVEMSEFDDNISLTSSAMYWILFHSPTNLTRVGIQILLMVKAVKSAHISSFAIISLHVRLKPHISPCEKKAWNERGMGDMQERRMGDMQEQARDTATSRQWSLHAFCLARWTEACEEAQD